MIVCGIDPGFGGALAILNDHGDCHVLSMPTIGEKAQAVINSAMVARFLDEFDVEFAIVEKAQAMPRQGVSSTFKYGVAYGQILAVVQCSLIPYELVTPQQWKREMGLSKDKEQSRLKATQRLPRAAKYWERKMDHGRAEAALLALWRLERGQ